MANSETKLKGSTSATDVTLRNPDDGSLRILKDSTEIFKVPAGGIPAFRAYRATSNQTIATSTITLVQFNTETYDTASAFDSATNYYFLPSVAGYYSVTATVLWASAATACQRTIYIYKNGSSHADAYLIQAASGGSNSDSISDIVYLNGSTDYVDVRVRQDTGSGRDLTLGSNYTYFSGCLLRAA